MNLKQIREAQGLTQQQLADLIGKDRSMVAKIETNRTSPSVETAQAIANILNINWTNFFNTEGEEKEL